MRRVISIFCLAFMLFMAGDVMAQNYGNGLPATDALGRKLPDAEEAGAPRKGKYVGTVDIKDTDNMRHRQYTGVHHDKILKNLSLVNEMNARIRLRCILVSGVNTDEHHYSAIAELANKIKNFIKN